MRGLLALILGPLIGLIIIGAIVLYLATAMAIFNPPLAEMHCSGDGSVYWERPGSGYHYNYDPDAKRRERMRRRNER